MKSAKIFAFWPIFKWKAKFSSQFPSFASRERITDLPLPIEKKLGPGESRQCWPQVWVSPPCLLGENGKALQTLFLSPLPLLLPPLTVSLTPLTALLELKINTCSGKPLGKNESELPRTDIIKVLESINRKFFSFFFFLRLSGCLVYSPEDKSIISDKKSCWGVRFYCDPVEETYVGNLDPLRQAVNARQAAMCGKQPQGRDSEPWLILFADVSEANASTMADFKLPMTKCLNI